MSAMGEPASVWDSTSSCCAECATPYHGISCPTCGERADATSVAHMAFLTETDDGPTVSIYASYGNGLSLQGSRPITEEQAQWLTR